MLGCSTKHERLCNSVINSAILLFAAFARADDLPIEDSLHKLNEYTPALTTELNKLAEASPHARAFLRESNTTGTLKFFGAVGYYALEAFGWSYRRCLLEFPALCAQGRLIACVRAEDTRHYVIYNTDGLGPFAATISPEKGFLWFSRGDTVTMEEGSGNYHYNVASDIRGDVLVARFEPRTILGATKRRVFIEYLYIHNQKIEALKHVLEEYPLPPK